MTSMKALHDLLCAKIDKRMSELSRRVASGQAKDFLEYKAITGRAQGLNDARTLVVETFKALLDEGDDE